MKVSDVCKIIEECDKLRNILLQDERALTGHEIQLCVYYYVLEAKDGIIDPKFEIKGA